MIKKEIKTTSAEEFKDENGCYIFPFKVLDETPGGKNLGRIEWHIEPVFCKRKLFCKRKNGIKKLLVFTSQTRDERYEGKVFEIPCFSECIVSNSLRDSYFHRVWRIVWCEVHKTDSFSAYPSNEHKALKINVNSQIAIDIDFIK